MRGLLGIAAILAFAWVISEDRWRIPWRLVLSGVALQAALALLFLKFPPAAASFLLLTHAVEAIQKATEAGAGFVFGYLGGGELPFTESRPGAAYIFAFRALPMVLVVSALATLLFYWGVLQRHRAGLCLGVAAYGRGRRAARARRGGAYFCRAYRGAAVDPAVSGDA